jgi:tRNA-dihydrouridine synthase
MAACNIEVAMPLNSLSTTAPQGRIILAPMEGVLDSLLREILTAVNHYDLCVTEFVRVVDQLLTRKHCTGFALNYCKVVKQPAVHLFVCSCWDNIRSGWRKMLCWRQN